MAKSPQQPVSSWRWKNRHARRKLTWLSNGQKGNSKTSSIYSAAMETDMQPLSQYGLMAEKHWREHRPQMVAEMERAGTLHQMLQDAEEKTKDEMDAIRRKLVQQGLTPQQAHDQAWEMVRERYILLPPEND
jgi:formate dehydrogenase maturation protein FdhE